MKLEDAIAKCRAEIEAFNEKSAEEREAFRIRILGQKGKLKALFSRFREVAPEQKKAIGQQLNTLRRLAENKIKINTDSSVSKKTQSAEDLSRPVGNRPGSRHPISAVQRDIIEIFSRIGFDVSTGPEIEDDWHNFSALNFTDDHPARDMQDTFFVAADEPMVLRTHTSSVQVRVMTGQKPPIRTISPGRVFRNEAITARAHCIFHQVEGLYIDRKVSFADLRQTLLYFCREMFGVKTNIRLRPSYFPFTEPSAELDINCNICGGKGCNICKYTGWVEILGCGMVDPNVLDNCKINSDHYTGFAFGMGIERIAMLKYNINDLRLFFENDLRFLSQFRAL